MRDSQRLTAIAASIDELDVSIGNDIRRIAAALTWKAEPTDVDLDTTKLFRFNCVVDKKRGLIIEDARTGQWLGPFELPEKPENPVDAP